MEHQCGSIVDCLHPRLLIGHPNREFVKHAVEVFPCHHINGIIASFDLIHTLNNLTMPVKFLSPWQVL
jgi:hypothetical protein